jgi:hypothetical protein
MEPANLAKRANPSYFTISYGISAGIFKQSIGARHRVGIGLSYWPARLLRLAELIPWIDSWAS